MSLSVLERWHLMATPLKKVPSQRQRKASIRSTRKTTSTYDGQKSGAKTRAEKIGVSAAQAEFLDALEESVQQANDNLLTPVEPVLDDLWAKYGDGNDPGN